MSDRRTERRFGPVLTVTPTGSNLLEFEEVLKPLVTNKLATVQPHLGIQTRSVTEIGEALPAPFDSYSTSTYSNARNLPERRFAQHRAGFKGSARGMCACAWPPLGRSSSRSNAKRASPGGASERG